MQLSFFLSGKTNCGRFIYFIAKISGQTSDAPSRGIFEALSALPASQTQVPVLPSGMEKQIAHWCPQV
jgi:hypothetical protein